RHGLLPSLAGVRIQTTGLLLSPISQMFVCKSNQRSSLHEVIFDMRDTKVFRRKKRFDVLPVHVQIQQLQVTLKAWSCMQAKV
ncbi:hypothetical protein CCACVL1_22373, partial [Corchorus capsularis]